MIPGKRFRHPSFKRSFLFALQGFRTALSQERNLKVMCGVGAVAIVAGIALRLDPLSWAIVLLCCGVVIAGELLNTAVETIIGLVSPEFHPLAGRAKDIAAAAVWSLSVFVALAGTIVYANALMRLLS